MKKNKRKALKVPESVEKTAETPLRRNVVDSTADSILDALNTMIKKHDLTFEEVLHAMDVVHLSIISKYINIRIEMKLEEVLKYADREARMYA